MRVTDPTLLRHLLWAGVDARLPLQVHAGNGGTDLDLHRSNVAALGLPAAPRAVVPFAKQLYSSDAWGAAELHYLGQRLWRNAMEKVVARLVEEGEYSPANARGSRP
ncbi:MAG: hypothetical protein ACRDWE_03365 [Acidimicrobiales bacterium]